MQIHLAEIWNNYNTETSAFQLVFGLFRES